MKVTLIIYKEENMQIDETMCFNVLKDDNNNSEEILKKVYDALKEKGYNPINQIVGYILSGDPTYITSYNGARNLIRQVERDDLLEKMVKKYIGVN
jgi:YD repeat-containing protein